jgi:hypothetical protein
MKISQINVLSDKPTNMEKSLNRCKKSDKISVLDIVIKRVCKIRNFPFSSYYLS